MDVPPCITLTSYSWAKALGNCLDGQEAMIKRDEGTGTVVEAPRKKFTIGDRDETEESKASKVKKFFRVMPLLVYTTFCGFVLKYFKSVNRKADSRLPTWIMKCETFQHVYLLIKVFKWIVLPASVLYVCSGFYFFGQNALDSMFLGILVFLYSNFLPDLPSIYRRKIHHDFRDKDEDLSWHKRYALLLFAPFFIGALFCGFRLVWKTTETFHNFKSSIVYAAFLLTLSFLAFGGSSISVGDITEILSLPLYGLTGYLAHLKVDLCL